MASRRLLASLWAVRGSNAVSHGSCVSSQIPRHIHAQGTIVREDSETRESGSWMPEWMRARMPGVLGGSREEIQEMQDLTLDSYASQLKMARRLGSMSGFAFGSTSASDPAAQGTLLLYEKIIERMNSAEREDVNAFSLNRKVIVAEQVGCSVEQVEDCIARFKWTQHMMRTLAAYRKKGNPMPKTMEELEQVVGKWQSFRSIEAGVASSGVSFFWKYCDCDGCCVAKGWKALWACRDDSRSIDEMSSISKVLQGVLWKIYTMTCIKIVFNDEEFQYG